MRIGLFPGTFNPVHKGHLKVLRAAAEQYGLQRVFIIPAGCTPNKGSVPFSSTLERWHLLTTAFCEFISCPVSLLANEINTSECSYTADTVKLVRSLFPEDELFLIIGEDNCASLPRWFEIEYILAKVKIIAASRSDSAELFRETSFTGKPIALLPALSPCSSSLIRENCLKGLPISDSVPEICEYGLYAYGLYLPELIRREIDFVKLHQKSHRFKHTVGVAKTAVSLACRLGINPLTALETAFLHDIAKELPDTLLFSLARRSPTDLGTTHISKVVHAPAGAELALQLFHIDTEKYNAILKHCTLDTEMTLLDKIIFISDMVEPSRHYPSVEKLRKPFECIENEKQLDKLLILAIELNICYITSVGEEVHPASRRALAVLKANISI